MLSIQTEDAYAMQLAIQQDIEPSQESRNNDRFNWLLLLTAGQPCREVDALSGAKSTTVHRWVNRFEAGGLDALRDSERWGRPCTLDTKDLHTLQGDLRKTWRVIELAASLWDWLVFSELLGQRYGVDFGVRQCQQLFPELRIRLRKPHPLVARTGPLKVAAIKKHRRRARQHDVELWTLDECNSQQHGSRSRMCVPPEIKYPILRRAATRKSLACLGALSLDTGQFGE